MHMTMTSPDDGSRGEGDATTAADALARSNLLRLEAAELIRESALRVHPAGDSSRADRDEARWAPHVRAYLAEVRGAVRGLERATLGPDVALLPPHGGGGEDAQPLYRVPLLSDKSSKSTRRTRDVAGIVDSPTSPTVAPWSFPFAGGASLDLVPVGSFGHAGCAGLAGRRANGNVVPVLDVAVLVPGECRNDEDDDVDRIGKGSGGDVTPFASGKDYLNHRYTDKRNILAVHIAKQLSQKKHRSKVGAVHLMRVFGDSRKVGLLLTPPIENASESSEKSSEGSKRKRKHDKKETDGKPKKNKGSKLRFRIRLIFGIKQGEYRGQDDHRKGKVNNGKWRGSVDEDTEALDHCWISRSRLLPDRCNNRSKGRGGAGEIMSIQNSTPHYTNSLAEDLHLLSTTNLVSSVASALSFGSDPEVSSSFHETLLLLKVWALQRGFLRGHDTFTTTTLAVILVYLHRTKGVGRRTGCVQALAAFLKFWSESDWLGEDGPPHGVGVGAAQSTDPAAARARKMKKKVAFVVPLEGQSELQTVAHCRQASLYLEDRRGRGLGGDGGQPDTLLECYKDCYTSSSSDGRHVDGPVLLDPTMTLNYLARLSPSFVRESRAEARAALRCIHSATDGSTGSAFQRLFLKTNRFWSRYDAYVRVPLPIVPRARPDSEKDQLWGNDADDLGLDESACRGVVEVLSRALGDRAFIVRAFTFGNGDVQLDGGCLNGEVYGGKEEVAVGAIVDSDQCPAVLMRGAGGRLGGFAAPIEAQRPAPPVPASLAPDVVGEPPCLAVGLRLDPDASRRLVDRGPPAEDVGGSRAFVSLWGDRRAQLRRFRDGAIVRAVVWTSDEDPFRGEDDNVQFLCADQSMGGIAERIVGHIAKLHFSEGVKFTKKRRKSNPASVPMFELRNMVSLIDGVAAAATPFSDSLALHKDVMAAFESLADFLRCNTAVDSLSSSKGRKISKLGLPLSIDGVEPLSPFLRYSALFPPLPHPLLGGSDVDRYLGDDKRKVSGVNAGTPILIQIRFEGSSKWPTSLNAMGAAKCAMLISLADGINKMKREQGANDDLDAFDGPMDVTPNYLDIGYRGFSWRIIVHVETELRMLRGLQNPTKEALDLRLSLINRHVRGAMHHSLIHAVHTRHPSASSVVRLAKRWVASHLLSDMIPHSAIELMVAKIYTDTSTNEIKPNNSKMIGFMIDSPPSTVVAGFRRFLQLLSTHDWVNSPLIVDPQSHITPHDRRLIHAQFIATRGPGLRKGPAMYIISPADYDTVDEMTGSKVVGDASLSAMRVAPSTNVDEKIWAPTFTANFPERVVLSRAAALAKCSQDRLAACITSGKMGNSWVAVFQESSASLTSYSALLRVDPSYVIDPGSSSANADCMIVDAHSEHSENKAQPGGPFERSLRNRYAGPEKLRKKYYKNLVLEKDTLHEWQPVRALVKALRSRYCQYAVFFYNEYAPDVIAMLWRPDAFKPQPFSAMVSEYKRPAADLWKDDSFVITNKDDIMAEIAHFSRNIISDIKVFDVKKPAGKSPKDRGEQPRQSGEKAVTVKK